MLVTAEQDRKDRTIENNRTRAISNEINRIVAPTNHYRSKGNEIERMQDLIPLHLQGIPLQQMMKKQLKEISWEKMTKEQLQGIPIEVLHKLTVKKLKDICRERDLGAPRTQEELLSLIEKFRTSPGPEPPKLAKEERAKLPMKKSYKKFMAKEGMREKRTAEERKRRLADPKRNEKQQKWRRDNPGKMAAYNATAKAKCDAKNKLVLHNFGLHCLPKNPA
jgi:hypothetical protein